MSRLSLITALGVIIAFLQSACSHWRYVPVTGSPNDRYSFDFHKVDLAKRDFSVECRWKPVNGGFRPAPQFCQYMSSLLSRLNGKVSTEDSQAERDEDEGQKAASAAPASLRMLVELRSLPERSSGFETTMLWMSLGFYPACSDSWYIVDIQVLDERGYVLRRGEFRALFRTYQGWGYWLYSEGRHLVDKQDDSNSNSSANSTDFYQFASRIAFDAVALSLKPEDPKGEVP